LTTHVGVMRVYGRPYKIVIRRPHVAEVTAPPKLTGVLATFVGFGQAAPAPVAAIVTLESVPLKRVLEPGVNELVLSCVHVHAVDVCGET